MQELTRFISIALCSLFLHGCASQIVEPTYYLLRSDNVAATSTLTPATDIAIGAIAIAPYLDQPGLLLQSPEGDIRPARTHLWAEPLRDGVYGFLLQEITRSSGIDLLPGVRPANATKINIRIDQLHGTNDGAATLLAYWWLSENGEVAAARRFSSEQALDADGYNALAKAQEILLRDLARDIAQHLGTLDRATL